MTKKKEYRNVNFNATPRILDKKWLDADFKRRIIREEKILKGWAVIDESYQEVYVIYRKKKYAEMEKPILGKYTVKKVKIIIEK